ncbi:DNA cytosine methyltransferase [Nostoc sp. C052]|uniref:DNA cytosine methyltransferase n=1 Tax=Nostoc sp. C052 TaxID=2576902 RepID=UPI0015C3B187|nr:DNA cytosine methyltransferase [Nostoc sp. C052]
MGEPTAGMLFCGGGGCSEGAVAAGYRPVWAIEDNLYAAAVYRKRFPGVLLIEQDITTISDEFIRTLPTPDIIIGGSPCQNFSLAGDRTGIKGTRSGLFFEFIRFLEIKQPPFVLWENVDSVLSSGGGQDFIKILDAFAEVGYVGNWQVRNGNRHVPQNRERIFVVGMHRRYSGNNSQAWVENSS